MYLVLVNTSPRSVCLAVDPCGLCDHEQLFSTLDVFGQDGHTDGAVAVLERGVVHLSNLLVDDDALVHILALYDGCTPSRGIPSPTT